MLPCKRSLFYNLGQMEGERWNGKNKEFSGSELLEDDWAVFFRTHWSGVYGALDLLALGDHEGTSFSLAQVSAQPPALRPGLSPGSHILVVDFLLP